MSVTLFCQKYYSDCQEWTNLSVCLMNVCLTNGIAMLLNCPLNAMDNSISECWLKCQNFLPSPFLRWSDYPTVPAHTNSTSELDDGNCSTRKTDYTAAANCCEIPYFLTMLIYCMPFLTDFHTTMSLLGPPFPPLSFSSDLQGWLRAL